MHDLTGADPSSAAGLSRNGSDLLFSAIMLTEGVTVRANLAVVKADTCATHRRADIRRKRSILFNPLEYLMYTLLHNSSS